MSAKQRSFLSGMSSQLKGDPATAGLCLLLAERPVGPLRRPRLDESWRRERFARATLPPVESPQRRGVWEEGVSSSMKFLYAVAASIALAAFAAAPASAQQLFRPAISGSGTVRARYRVGCASRIVANGTITGLAGPRCGPHHFPDIDHPGRDAAATPANHWHSCAGGLPRAVQLTCQMCLLRRGAGHGFPVVPCSRITRPTVLQPAVTYSTTMTAPSR